MEHLIPQDLFTNLPQWLLLVVAVAGIAILIFGADWVVDGASGLAMRWGMPQVIVGATVVSLGTTSPECAVSVMAAWSGQPGLALGNAVGSVIADTALIFGVCCLMTTLPADRFVLNRQGWVQLLSGILLAALCYGSYAMHGSDALLGRPVGILLLTLLVAYLAISVHWSRQHSHGASLQTPGEVTGSPVTPRPESHQLHRSAALLALKLLVGLAVVLLSSRVLICDVTVLAGRWGVPQVVVAATLVAVGTSLPELVVGLASIAKGHTELLVGNVIGADILNCLFVVGASAAAAQLPIVDDGNTIFLYLHLPTMLGSLIVLRLFMFSAIRSGQFKRWYGIPLLLTYIAYVVGQFLLSGQQA